MHLFDYNIALFSAYVTYKNGPTSIILTFVVLNRLTKSYPKHFDDIYKLIDVTIWLQN